MDAPDAALKSARLQCGVDLPCIYLDNASTSWPKPPEVAAEMARFVAEGAASPGRGGYRMAARNAEIVARLRGRLAMLVGARPDQIVLTSGATAALNTAILGLFAARLYAGGAAPDAPGARARVVTTVMEHNAVRRPLAHLRSIGLIEVVEVGCDEGGRISADAVVGAVDERTVLVAMQTASNVTGLISPALEVARRLRSGPVLVLLDGSQTVGLVDIDVAASGVDMLAFPGHKALMGPTGIGGLYLSDRAVGAQAGTRRTVEPVQFGGTGVDAGDEFMTRAMPTRFEAGTSNVVAAAGLLAAIESLSRPPAGEVLAHERALVESAVAGLGSLPGVRIVGPGEGRIGVVSIEVRGWAPTDLAGALDSSFGIALRAGVHCAPGAHRALGTFDRGGTLRASPGVYNTASEVEGLVGALAALVG